MCLNPVVVMFVIGGCPIYLLLAITVVSLHLSGLFLLAIVVLTLSFLQSDLNLLLFSSNVVLVV